MEPEVKESLKIRLGESIIGKQQGNEPRVGSSEPIDRRRPSEEQQQTENVQATVSRVILKMIRKHDDPMSYDIVDNNDNQPRYRVEEKQETTTSTNLVKAKQQEVKQEPAPAPTPQPTPIQEMVDIGAGNNAPNDIEQQGDKEMLEEEDEEEEEDEAEEEDDEVGAEAEIEDVEMKPANEGDKEKDSAQEETPSSLGRNRRVRQKNRYFLDFHCIDLTKGARSNKDDYDTYTTGIRSSNRRSTTDSRGQLEETTAEVFESRYCRKCSSKTARDLDGECQACLYKKIVESSSRRRGATCQKSSTSASQKNRSSNAKQQRQKQVNNNTIESTSKPSLASTNSNNRRKASKQASSKSNNNIINNNSNVVNSNIVSSQPAITNIATTNSSPTTNATIATNTSPSRNEIKNEITTSGAISNTTKPTNNTNSVVVTTSVSPPNESINQDSSSSSSSTSSSSSSNNSIRSSNSTSSNEGSTKLPKLDSWSPDEVAEYITSKGFVDEAELFKLQSVDGIALLLMQRTDFTYGLKIKLGPALKIYDQVCKLKRDYFQAITIQ